MRSRATSRPSACSSGASPKAGSRCASSSSCPSPTSPSRTSTTGPSSSTASSTDRWRPSSSGERARPRSSPPSRSAPERSPRLNTNSSGRCSIASTERGDGEMAVTVGVLNDTQRRTLEALCDTFAPSIEVDGAEALRDFYARSASDLGVPGQIEGLLAQSLMPEEIDALGQLLEAFDEQDFASLPLGARTELLHAIADSSPDAKLGVRQLRALTFLFFYALPDETGHNLNWDALGYPGPISAPPSPEDAPKTIAVERVAGESATLQADV